MFHFYILTTKGQKDKLSHAGIYGVDNSVKTMNDLYGVKIDYYFKLNFTGFVNIVDELGGVDVESEYDFTVNNIRTYKKGVNKNLSGVEALAFVRERKSFNNDDYHYAGDFQRGRHQLLFFSAMVKKVCTPNTLKNFSSIRNNLSNSYSTDFSEKYLATIVANQLKDNSEWKVDRFVLGADDIREEYTYTYPNEKTTVVIPSEADLEKARQLINATLNETK